MIPVILAGLLVLVLAGAALAGVFSSGPSLDPESIAKLERATGWRSTRTQFGSRDEVRLVPPDNAWYIVLRKQERDGARGADGVASVVSSGGSGTGWHAKLPTFAEGFVAISPGKSASPLPPGNLLEGPGGAMLAMLWPRVGETITGGNVPVPTQLFVARTGDAAFDAVYQVLADRVGLGEGVVTAEVRAALLAEKRHSLVLSSAGMHLTIPGPPVPEAAELSALVKLGTQLHTALQR